MQRLILSNTESYGLSGGLPIICGGRHFWITSGKIPINGQPCACGQMRWYVDTCGECGAEKFAPKKERP